MGLAWESVRWRDGSVYEGTAVDGKAQGRGTLRYANGDKYEGQFASNYQHGFGAYVWKDGTVYRGQWALGEMRGCGVRISKGHGGGFDVEEGYFHNGDHVGELWGCSVRAAREAAAEADIAAAMARKMQLGGKHHAPTALRGSPASISHAQAARSGAELGARVESGAAGGVMRRKLGRLDDDYTSTHAKPHGNPFVGAIRAVRRAMERAVPPRG